MRIALPHLMDMASFADRGVNAAICRIGGETMGTGWSVLFASGTPANADRVSSLVEARLADIVAQMSHWEPDSLLSRFNRDAAGSWTTLPVDFVTVMEKGLAIAEASGGTFDPTIGALADIWGFGPAGPRAAPTEQAVASALGRGGWQKLAFDPATRRLRQPGGLALDFSGIAKGFAVDAVADALRDSGLRHVLVEIGGELAGRGIRPDGEPWWVDLEVPPGISCAPLRVALHGLAVATSGLYRRGHHTIDPRNGRPVMNGIVSLSVIAHSALEADAWATALTVAGPDKGMEMAESHGIAARFLVQTEGPPVRELVTSPLLAMLQD